jgi:glutamate/tyrosine decarboxylase-like PLP-dependent enzyme
MSERPRIPTDGVAHDRVLAAMRDFRAGDADWRGGRTFSLVYFAGEAHHQLLQDASLLYFAENALNPLAFRSLKRMEAEIVQMSASMLHGPDGCVGTLTTGGTESILMAVKAARDLARSERPWIRRPEIVAPTTIHAAFDKAAHYFGLELRRVRLAEDFRVDVEALANAVNRNTVLIAASAPQYPHGVLDPIEAIGALASKRGIPFHVDACIGGFVLPWIEKLGHAIPPFDFRVPGVTSISADLHKYGFAAKGASVVLYRDMRHLKHQFFVATDWPGGIYLSPSMTGTRAAGPIAAAWASLMAMGEAGFLDHTRRAMSATRRLRDGIAAIDGLSVIGDPIATIVAYRSTTDSVDLYAVADALARRGWSVDRQQSPPSLHCTVTSNHAPVIDEYVRDLAASVDEVRGKTASNAGGTAAMYGMMAKVPVRGLVKRSVLKVMEQLYGTSIEPPDPATLGQGGTGMVDVLLAKHGDAIGALLDRLDRARTKLRRGRR